MPPNGAVPVEALLKLSLDKAGAQGIQDFLDKQESSFSRVEQYTSKISSNLEGLARGALGVAGIAGLGAILNQFLQVSQAGGQVGLAAGNVTGGMGVSHSYGQALLSAQAATGVSSGQIAEGLVQAVQAVGGNPSPAQAAVLGGLLAGYGNTVGLTPSQVASVVTPILQASNKPLSPGGLLSSMAGLTQGLTAFPGSQAAPMLGLLSQLGITQALGGGPGFTPDMHGLTAAVNAAAQTNSIFRNPQIAGSAINAITGGLQSAYGNPSVEAFLQRSGISYRQQREGFTPQNIQAIMRGATSEYGSGTLRDLTLRSMFGLQGTDLLEEFSPGSRGAALLHRDLGLHLHPDVQQLRNQIHNAQLSHTPQADINKLSAQALRWLFESPLHAALGLGGAGAAFKFGGAAIKYGAKGISAAARAAMRGIRGGGAGAAGDAADPYGGDTADGWFTHPADATGAGAGGAGVEEGALRGILGDIAGGLGGAGLGAVAGSLLFPDSTSDPGMGLSGKNAEQIAVQNVMRMALKKFGARGMRSPQAVAWMKAQLQMPTGGKFGTGFSVYPEAIQGLLNQGQMAGLQVGASNYLDQVLGGGKRTSGGKDPLDAFTQGAQDMEKAAQGLLQWLQRGSGPGFTSYSGLGTPGVQALGAGAPGLELTAFAGTGASTALYAAFGGPVGSIPGQAPGSSGQPVSFTTPVSGAGAPAGQVAPGDAKQIIANAAAKYGVPFWVLWGVFGAESSFGTAYKGGGSTFGFFGLTSQGLWKSSFSFQQDAETAAQLLAKLYSQYGNWDAAIQAYSGNNYGASHVQALAGGTPSGPSPSSNGGASAPTGGAGHTGLGVNGGSGGGGGGGGGGQGGGVMDAPMRRAVAAGARPIARGRDHRRHHDHGHGAPAARPHVAEALQVVQQHQHQHSTHVYVDGKEIRQHRILTGHRP